MSKLTPPHIAILKSLSAQDGPVPIDQLSGLSTTGGALEAHLDHLSSRGFLTRTGKAIALTEVGQAALAQAPARTITKARRKSASAPAAAAAAEGQPDKLTKKARLIALLTVETGITIPDLAARLDWLPHTTRAAMTGLRKNGYTIDKLPPLEGTRSARFKLIEAG